MAINFLTSINLNGNQLIKPVIENVTSNPTLESAKGRLAFNSTNNTPIVYDGEAWRNLQYEIPDGVYDNAVSATVLKTPRYFSIKNGATAEAIEFNGSANVVLEVTALNASKLGGTIPSSVIGMSTLYIGTTPIKLNRPSESLPLTGITSIELATEVTVKPIITYDINSKSISIKHSDGGHPLNFHATGDIVGSNMLDNWTDYSTSTEKWFLTAKLGKELLDTKATKAYVDEKFDLLMENPSEAMDSIVEIITALGNNPAGVDDLFTEIGKKETKIIAGTEAQYWRGDKTWATLSTTVIAEGDKLFYTDERVKTHGDTLYLGKDATASKATELETERMFSIAGYTGLKATGISFNGGSNVEFVLNGELNIANGGTGLTEAKNGFARRVVGTLNTSATSYEITHNLDNRDVIVQVIEIASNTVVECDIVMTSTNKATIMFNKEPDANAYRYIIIG